MLSSERIVTQLPLEALWSHQGNLDTVRERYLDKAAIREVLSESSVEFVVADVGSKLKWIPPGKCYEFWKQEVQEHVAQNPDRILLDEFPDRYTYVASQWTSKDKIPIILLEKVH
jgi:hypothetical protein